jgi:FtsP/CotA-like multicopper oxidase with cupredoxin domain
MVTQCPIQPNTTFTYRFNVDGQVGTLWWHSHVSILRATLHGIVVIRPQVQLLLPIPETPRGCSHHHRYCIY